MNSLFKFPRRVRIHGGECGAVARALHHEAESLSLPAVSENVSFTTNERKQMSTKTTFKRIALVAVAALGFGVLSTVPASAARTLDGTSNLNNITASTNRTPVAGTNGNSAVTTFTFTSDSTTAAPTISPVVKLTSKPSTSAMSDTNTAYATTLSTTGTWNMQTGTVAQTVANAVAWTTSGGSAFDTQGADLALSTVNQAGYYSGTLSVHARYDVAGSYTWTVFDDTNNDKIINSRDFARSFTVVVSGSSNTTAAWNISCSEHIICCCWYLWCTS